MRTEWLDNNFYLVNHCSPEYVIWQGSPKNGSLFNDIQHLPKAKFEKLIQTQQILFVERRGPMIEVWIPVPTDKELRQRLMECERLIQEFPLELKYRQMKKFWQDVDCAKTDVMLFG